MFEALFGSEMPLAARFFIAFLVVLGLMIAATLQWMLVRTRHGARLRAAVDHPRAARGLGIDVDRVFAIAFALGSGLAGLGGALGEAQQLLALEGPVLRHARHARGAVEHRTRVGAGGHAADLGGKFLDRQHLVHRGIQRMTIIKKLLEWFEARVWCD